MPGVSGRGLAALALLAGIGLLAMAAALAVGSVPITVTQLLAVLTGGGDPLHRELLLSLRLPRALAAFATGGLLSLAGALMQVLLRNPLADPYVLGLSGARRWAPWAPCCWARRRSECPAPPSPEPCSPPCWCSAWPRAWAAGRPPGCCSPAWWWPPAGAPWSPSCSP